MNPFEALLLLVLGWLLGLLGPLITEKIRRVHRAGEIKRAILSELDQVKFKMAFVAFMVSKRLGVLSDSFLDWCEPLLRVHAGPEPMGDLLKAIEKYRAVPESKRAGGIVAESDAESAAMIPQLEVPVLATLITEMYNCPLKFRTGILRIKEHLSLYNGNAADIQRLFFMTFDVRSNSNHDLIRENINKRYLELARRAVIVASLIDAVQRADG